MDKEGQMQSKAPKTKKQTGTQKKAVKAAAGSKRKIAARGGGTINVKMARSMWDLLSEIGEKIFTKSNRGKRQLNSKYADPICLILANGDKEAAAALKVRVLQAQKDFFESAGDSVKFAA
jgi:hypothetical protein